MDRVQRLTIILFLNTQDLIQVPIVFSTHYIHLNKLHVNRKGYSTAQIICGTDFGYLFSFILI